MKNPSDHEIREGRLDVDDGHHIHFRHFVPNTPVDQIAVLCLPGFWRNARDFERIASLLALSRIVVTPDMRGRGGSSRATDAGDYRFERLIEDVWRLLDHLNIETCVVIGTTLGGFMGLQMACANRKRIVGLVLNDVGTETTSIASKRYSALVDHAEWSLDQVVAKTKLANLDFFPDFNEEDWQEFTLQAYRRVGDDRYTRDFDELTGEETARFKREKTSFWDEFMSLDIPIAILRGERSDYFPEALAREMAQNHPRATLSIVDGRGHPPLLDEPQSRKAIEGVLQAVCVPIDLSHPIA
ncbi:alpha/beta fold hydrolase [Agrobacterium sp. LAD9]|uniref:alpha/beta fold hydrolase n=1 Tax=Agrobacterium sp. LAD9 TaxID=2055153 RepID=UPI000D1E375D|nr:alpha/beta hydrolase [Agrobacterium sp. LAD9]